MAITLAAATRNAMTDAAVGALDGGTVQIRSGTRPSSANDSATGTLLATITLQNPAYAASSAGAAVLADPAMISAVATGTATWFRALTSASATRFDGDVSETGGGGDMTLATTSITTGLAVDITGGSFVTPSGE